LRGKSRGDETDKGERGGGKEGTHQSPTVTFTTDIKQHATGLSVYGAGVREWYSKREDGCGEKVRRLRVGGSDLLFEIR
jgi:hypothetical protein